jgi:hypothetical protein
MTQRVPPELIADYERERTVVRFERGDLEGADRALRPG